MVPGRLSTWAVLILVMLSLFTVLHSVFTISYFRGQLNSVMNENEKLKEQLRIGQAPPDPNVLHIHVDEQKMLDRLGQLIDNVDNLLGSDEFLRSMLIKRLKDLGIPGADNPEELLNSLRETRKQLQEHLRKQREEQKDPPKFFQPPQPEKKT